MRPGGGRTDGDARRIFGIAQVAGNVELDDLIRFLVNVGVERSALKCEGHG